MSSYICSPEHFNTVEFYLTQKQHGSDQLYSLRKLAKTAEKWATTEEITEFMDTLRGLSILCVTLQYKHHYKGRVDKEIEEQTENLKNCKLIGVPLTDVGAFKALQCIKYQIETEHLKELRNLTVKEELAMNLLNEVTDEIAAQIVRKLPAYNKAKWSIG